VTDFLRLKIEIYGYRRVAERAEFFASVREWIADAVTGGRGDGDWFGELEDLFSDVRSIWKTMEEREAEGSVNLNHDSREHGVGVQTIDGRRERFGGPTSPYPGFVETTPPSLRSFRPFGPGSRTADPSPRARRSARHQVRRNDDPFAPVSSALWAWDRRVSFTTGVRRSARHQGSSKGRPLRSGLIGPLGLGVVPPTPYPGFVETPTPYPGFVETSGLGSTDFARNRGSSPCIYHDA
jgi:hypothetical protein